MNERRHQSTPMDTFELQVTRTPINTEFGLNFPSAKPAAAHRKNLPPFKDILHRPKKPIQEMMTSKLIKNWKMSSKQLYSYIQDAKAALQLGSKLGFTKHPQLKKHNLLTPAEIESLRKDQKIDPSVVLLLKTADTFNIPVTEPMLPGDFSRGSTPSESYSVRSMSNNVFGSRSADSLKTCADIRKDEEKSRLVAKMTTCSVPLAGRVITDRGTFTTNELSARTPPSSSDELTSRALSSAADEMLSKVERFVDKSRKPVKRLEGSKIFEIPKSTGLHIEYRTLSPDVTSFKFARQITKDDSPQKIPRISSLPIDGQNLRPGIPAGELPKGDSLKRTDQTPTGELVGQIPTGELAGQIITGELAGQIPTGELVGQILTGELVGQIPTGELAGQIPTGELVGQIPTGELAGQIITGELAGQIPTGELVGQILTGELAGQISTDEPAGQIPAGELAGQIPTGDIAGQIPTGEISGQIPAGEIAGQIPAGELAGQIPAGELAGQISIGEPAGQILAGKLAGQISTGEPAGQIPAGELTGQIPTDELAGQIPTDELAGQIPTDKLAGQIPTGELTGQIPTDELAGQIPAGELTGQIPTDELAGQIPTDELAGQIPTDKLAGQIPTDRLAGQIPASEQASQLPADPMRRTDVPAGELANQIPTGEPAGQMPAGKIAQQTTKVDSLQRTRSSRSNAKSTPAGKLARKLTKDGLKQRKSSRTTDHPIPEKIARTMSTIRVLDKTDQIEYFKHRLKEPCLPPDELEKHLMLLQKPSRGILSSLSKRKLRRTSPSAKEQQKTEENIKKPKDIDLTRNEAVPTKRGPLTPITTSEERPPKLDQSSDKVEHLEEDKSKGDKGAASTGAEDAFGRARKMSKKLSKKYGTDESSMKAKFQDLKGTEKLDEAACLEALDGIWENYEKNNKISEEVPTQDLESFFENAKGQFQHYFSKRNDEAGNFIKNVTFRMKEDKISKEQAMLLLKDALADPHMAQLREWVNSLEEEDASKTVKADVGSGEGEQLKDAADVTTDGTSGLGKDVDAAEGESTKVKCEAGEKENLTVPKGVTAEEPALKKAAEAKKLEKPVSAIPAKVSEDATSKGKSKSVSPSNISSISQGLKKGSTPDTVVSKGGITVPDSVSSVDSTPTGITMVHGDSSGAHMVPTKGPLKESTKGPTEDPPTVPTEGLSTDPTKRGPLTPITNAEERTSPAPKLDQSSDKVAHLKENKSKGGKRKLSIPPIKKPLSKEDISVVDELLTRNDHTTAKVTFLEAASTESSARDAMTTDGSHLKVNLTGAASTGAEDAFGRARKMSKKLSKKYGTDESSMNPLPSEGAKGKPKGKTLPQSEPEKIKKRKSNLDEKKPLPSIGSGKKLERSESMVIKKKPTIRTKSDTSKQAAKTEKQQLLSRKSRRKTTDEDKLKSMFFDQNAKEDFIQMGLEKIILIAQDSKHKSQEFNASKKQLMDPIQVRDRLHQRREQVNHLILGMSEEKGMQMETMMQSQHELFEELETYEDEEIHETLSLLTKVLHLDLEKKSPEGQRADEPEIPKKEKYIHIPQAKEAVTLTVRREVKEEGGREEEEGEGKDEEKERRDKTSEEKEDVKVPFITSVVPEIGEVLDESLFKNALLKMKALNIVNAIKALGIIDPRMKDFDEYITQNNVTEFMDAEEIHHLRMSAAELFVFKGKGPSKSPLRRSSSNLKAKDVKNIPALMHNQKCSVIVKEPSEAVVDVERQQKQAALANMKQELEMLGFEQEITEPYIFSYYVQWLKTVKPPSKPGKKK